MKMKATRVFVVLLLSSVCFVARAFPEAIAAADPEAEPEAIAAADPEADPEAQISGSAVRFHTVPLVCCKCFFVQLEFEI